jgi:hypothetical protein
MTRISATAMETTLQCRSEWISSVGNRQKVGTRAGSARFQCDIHDTWIWTMNRRDRELLEKQLRPLTMPPRSDGVLVLATLAVFFGGMAIGGFVFGYEGGAAPIGVHNAVPAMSSPNMSVAMRR